MSWDAGLTVPKDRQGVVIHLANGESLEGEIFMEAIVGELSMHQKITAFLEQGKRFFPIKTAASTVFINKTTIKYLEVAIPADPAAKFFPHLLMQTVPVTAHFHGSGSLSGQIMAEVPQETARLSDCLNVPSPYLNIYAGGKMYYVNKDALATVAHADGR
jgi:hypothetical protein